jgi:PAS domain S-box-containing protein
MPDSSKSQPLWTGYVFAIVAAGVAFVFRFEVDQIFSTHISIPLCGLAAIFACIWRAGMGPALVASVLTTGWYVWEAGATKGPSVWLHGALYLTEAIIFCIYGRHMRMARAAASQGEDWREHLVQTSAEGIWTVDPDGVIGYANPRIAEMLGCRTADITGRKFEDFLFPEDLPSERIRFENRRPGVREQYDRRLRRTNGEAVWTLASSSPYIYRAKDAGLLTMMTDITERKKAESALRRSEQQYRELFENIREGVYQTSPDGRILAANPELLRMLGFSSQEELNIPGVVKETFVDADLHQSLRDRLERDGSYSKVEFQLRTRDHRVITVWENARVVRDENGAALYYEGTLTDVTKKLNLEGQMRRARETEAMGRFAAGIAEDLYTLSSCADPQKSGQRLTALARHIRDFGQQPLSVDGGFEESIDSVDINAVVSGFEPTLRGLLRSQDSLLLSLCEKPVRVLINPLHLQQILLSLVTHICDACEQEDGTQIFVETRIEPMGDADEACLSVRLNDTIHAPWIGLASSRAILEQYEGRLIADSGTFHLHLPLAAGAYSSASFHAGVSAPTVLLVDEEPLFREIGRDMLERQGFRVLAAANTTEADRIAQAGQSLDVLVANSNETVRRIRDIRPNLPALFISSDDPISRHEPGEVNTPVLQKPFSAEALGREVRQLLKVVKTSDPKNETAR